MDSLHLLTQDPGWAVPVYNKIPFNSWIQASHVEHTNETALGYLSTQANPHGAGLVSHRGTVQGEVMKSEVP